MIMNAGMDLPVYSTNRVLLRQALQPDVPRTDALLAVLLGYLPGLERLEIPIESEDPPGGPPITEPNLIQRVLVSLTGALSTPNSEIGVATSAVEGNTRLPKLTHLKAEVNGDSPSADIDSLMALLRMSTLTHVFGTKWTTTQPWHRPLIADSHHLVHLELRECTFDAQNLRSLLKQAHNLQTLIYERGWTVRKDWRLKASDLIRALQETSQTLACLELSYNRFIRRIQEDLYLQPLNLSGLVHLKRLRISAGYLVQTGVKKELFEGSFWRHFDETGAYNSTLPLHQLLPKSLEQLHIFQIHDELEFTLMSNKLCESLYGRAVPILSEAHQFEHLKEIIIEAPFEDQGAYFFSTLFEVTNRAGVKLTAIENSADYIKSWVTHNSKVSCPSRDINWGFDGEIQWENPFTQRGEVRYHRR
ncbi:uncharacterized protein N7479_008037 [Penicillium vulpinum]|uniref:uncharacterized protein n=1 Tax=Penicillium vulpinum TaxID=29845 RepID=UPI0025482828|nr:uncharacterized protein N7479_008037 [Penicillium vulpinum]KAJ5960887.1 hypothetical protein N7479_008037 [Penicillium vulpinum]